MEEREAGERLDRILAARVPAVSRSTFARWIRDGRVTVDGAVGTRRDRPRAGVTIVARPAPAPPTAAYPQDLPIDVVFEDPHLIVVNKAAGMVVHPGAGHPDGTLVNAVLHHFGALPGEDAARPGIVHRLDAGTSGVMVVARTPAARDGLMRCFADHDIERAYLAIAQGAPPAKATYDTLYGRHPVRRRRFSSKVNRGKRAVTHVERVEKLHAAALMRCTLETGRTHQIRVHLADAGCAVLGDPTYGRRRQDPRLLAAAAALGHQALHAAVLGFVHPVTQEPMRFEREPPPEYLEALALLR